MGFNIRPAADSLAIALLAEGLVVLAVLAFICAIIIGIMP